MLEPKYSFLKFYELYVPFVNEETVEMFGLTKECLEKVRKQGTNFSHCQEDILVKMGQLYCKTSVCKVVDDPPFKLYVD